MEHPVTRKMALLQNPEIIVHNPPSDGTLRGAAEEIGIHAITLELGDPNKFQRGMIEAGLTGIQNLLSHLKMINEPIVEPDEPPLICNSSYWLYTDNGGVLRVLPQVVQIVEQNEVVATLSDIFGNPVEEYIAEERGVVIGKETYPIAQTGERLIHLGILKK
jgi:predicted deacylase